MRVAFLNRKQHTYPSGDVLSINETVEALKKIGVEATYLYGEWEAKNLADFDLVHIRHLNFSWSRHNFYETWKAEKPYVLTPCFYPTVDLGMRVEEMREAVERAHVVMPFTFEEWREMRQILGIGPHFGLQVLPNGISSKFFSYSDPWQREMVLAVSARGGDKQVDRVRAVCERLKFPFTLVTETDYEKMPELYHSHRVFVSASESERMSRTVTEALAANCRVLSSVGNWGNEWYPGLKIFNPKGDQMLEVCVDCAYRMSPGVWNERHGRANVTARIWTWETLAMRLKQMYEAVCNP